MCLGKLALLKETISGIWWTVTIAGNAFLNLDNFCKIVFDFYAQVKNVMYIERL